MQIWIDNMTVINAMRFSKDSGGMVADSQGSTETRKYDIFDKASLLGDNILIGGTGSSSVLGDSGNKLRWIYQKDKTVYQNAVELSKILTDVYRSFIDQEMRTRFSFGVNEFIAGKLADGTPIGPHIIPSAGELYEGRDRAAAQTRQNAFIVIGKDAEDCFIYQVPMGGQPYLWPAPFASVGSGQDESDNVLHDFLKSVPRAGRQEINFVDGMAALIRATNRSSDINKGVGGVPTIAYFTKEASTVLPEEDSLLATEIVKVADKELVDRHRAMNSLEGLLLRTKSPEDIELELFENTPGIMKFLRGYRS